MGFDIYLSLLNKFVGFKSISTDPKYQEDLQLTAHWLSTLFEENGFESTVKTGYGNPIVLARYHVDKSFPTCLIYGHYDVQPADISDRWASDPFILRKDDEKLYGRGVVDNKGQTLIHMVSIFELLKQKKLGMNIIFLIEGDEETGRADLERFIKDHKESVRADFALISDGEMKGNLPTIEAGLRGGFNATLIIKTADKDLHSGIYGGTTPNAAHELARVIGTFHTANNHIQIPGFYDDVDSVSFRDEGEESGSGIKESRLNIGLIPAIEVTSIRAGYQGEGYRNSIPGSATAKINVRVVKSQEPHKLYNLLELFVKEQLPPYASYELHIDHPHNAVKLNLAGEYVKRASRILKKVYGKNPQFTYSGGAIPIVDYFTNIMKMPTLLVNLANEDCNMHSIDENFDIELIKKALTFSKLFFTS